MRLIFGLILSTLPLLPARAESVLPTTEGMTWKFQMTQEFGEGVRPSSPAIKPDADGKIRLPVTVFVAGSEKIGDAEAHKFELHRQGALQLTEFLQVKDDGIFGLARMGESGEKTNLNPPQKTLSFPLKTGNKWEYHGQSADSKIDETYEIIGEESVQVPAGKFQAYHVRLLQTTPYQAVVDRWFVPNVGYIKDVTEVKRPSGALLQRISLELTEPPKVGPRPEAKASKPAKKLTVTVGKDAVGEAATKFSSRTPKIYARWKGHELGTQAKIRAVWIAENIGKISPPNYTIDEATTTATAPDSRGIFTLGRPDGGWAPGDYRVEFYVDDALVETVKLKIVK